jgi:aldehyde:ferredoxin oxidoreductase
MNRPSLYAGKILRVDLSSATTDIIDTMNYADRYLGGRGVATALYHEEVPPECSAFDEENRIIISMGPLSGIPGGLGGSRWGIFTKSPLPAGHRGRDHFCYGNLGGTFGAELRFAGWDGIVIQGRAEKPVWIEIVDEQVRFHSAEDLWGKSTVETRETLKSEAETKVRTLAIGPAGENRVPLATVFAEGDASCSGGVGSVFGAKNLKAITVRGSLRRVEVADRERLKEIENEIRGYGRGNVKVWGLDFMAHGPKTRKLPCFGCMASCLRVSYQADNGVRGKFMCQSRFFYMHHAWGYYGEDNDVPFLANRTCDEYGIDTWEIQTLIEWLLLCHAEGILTGEETGIPLDKVGSLEFVESLVRKVSLREGMGDVLAPGAEAAARKLGGRMHSVFTKTDPYDPRYCKVNTLLFPFDTREPIQQLHEAGLVLSQWSSWAKGVEEAHISSDVIRGIGERFWGSVEAADMTTLDGKAGAAKKIQERQMTKESMGVCDWMFPIIDNPLGDDHVGDPGVESRILSAATGIDYSEEDLYRIGERVFNLQRAVLLREGHRAREDDFLPEEWHNKPIETHVADPEVIVPDGTGKVTSAVGDVVEKKDFLRIRDEFYELRGWDVPTGLPSLRTLKKLDMEDVGKDLFKRGLAVRGERGVPMTTRILRSLDRLVSSLRPGKEEKSERYPFLERESLEDGELMFILEDDVQKYGHPSISHNFRGWNKDMLYYFTDLDRYYVIRFVDGRAEKPEKLDGPLEKPEITYEMDSRVLKAMSEGELSGEQAYLKRLLRMKASFGDMMKLQSLNKVPSPSKEEAR